MKILLSLLLVSFAGPISATGIDGIYEGNLRLQLSGTAPYEVPIAVSLTPTGEIRYVPQGSGIFREEQVIDGAFVIDGEGGPYAFHRVSFRVEENRFDLRYDRPDLTLGQSPATFRLIGKVMNDGSLEGTVNTGRNGPAGTFRLALSHARSLAIVPKYVGTWEGTCTMGGGRKMKIRLAPSMLVTENPFDHEFEYTPGRLAVMFYNDIPFAISDVVFDYLRHKIYLIQKSVGNGDTLTLEGTYDPISQKITGFSAGKYVGRTGDFEVSKISNP